MYNFKSQLSIPLILILISTFGNVFKTDAFFQERRFGSGVRFTFSYRTPVKTSRSQYDINKSILQRSLDLGLANFLLESGFNAVNDVWTNNSTNLVRSVAKQVKLALHQLDIDAILSQFGVRDEACKKQILCDLNKFLSTQNNYKAKFASWALNHHVPTMKDMRRAFSSCELKKIDCEKQFPGSCPVSFHTILNFLR